MRRRSSAVCFLPAFCQPPFWNIQRRNTYKGVRFWNRQRNTMRDGSTCLAAHLTVCEAHKCRTSPWRRRGSFFFSFFFCATPRRPCSTLDSDTQPGCESVYSSVCLHFQNIRSKLMTTIIAAYWEWWRLVVIALPPPPPLPLLVIMIKMSGTGGDDDEGCSY